MLRFVLFFILQRNLYNCCITHLRHGYYDLLLKLHCCSKLRMHVDLSSRISAMKAFMLSLIHALHTGVHRCRHCMHTYTCACTCTCSCTCVCILGLCVQVLQESCNRELEIWSFSSFDGTLVLTTQEQEVNKGKFAL